MEEGGEGGEERDKQREHSKNMQSDTCAFSVIVMVKNCFVLPRDHKTNVESRVQCSLSQSKAQDLAHDAPQVQHPQLV